MSRKTVNGQRQHPDVDEGDGQAPECRGDGPAAQAVAGFRHQQHGQQVSQAAAKAEAHGLAQRKALGALHQHRAQHAAVDGGQGQNAQQLAAAGPFDEPQHQMLKQADHGQAGHIDQRTQLGAVGQRGQNAARIVSQRSHQHLRHAQQQRKPPAVGAVVTHQLHQTGNAEAAGEDGVLGKNGQHRIAEENAYGMHHITHARGSPPSADGPRRGCRPRSSGNACAAGPPPATQRTARPAPETLRRADWPRAAPGG